MCTHLWDLIHNVMPLIEFAKMVNFVRSWVIEQVDPCWSKLIQVDPSWSKLPSLNEINLRHWSLQPGCVSFLRDLHAIHTFPLGQANVALGISPCSVHATQYTAWDNLSSGDLASHAGKPQHVPNGLRIMQIKFQTEYICMFKYGCHMSEKNTHDIAAASEHQWLSTQDLESRTNLFRYYSHTDAWERFMFIQFFHLPSTSQLQVLEQFLILSLKRVPLDWTWLN